MAEDRKTRNLQHLKQKSTAKVDILSHVNPNELTEGIPKKIYIKGSGIYDVVKYNGQIYYSMRYSVTKDTYTSDDVLLGGSGDSSGKGSGLTTHAERHYSKGDDVLLLDEDNMTSNDANKGASQQSIKAYVDVGGINITSKIVDYTASFNDMILCDGTFVVTMPDISSDDLGKRVQIQNEGTGIITGNGNGDDTFYGEKTIECIVNATLTLMATTLTTWVLV